ncbi:relaxase/mobilization nuclease domain-containing protein [Cognatishimia sp. F0-27]|uniref:relaxase/mobilization nuclease domain-containing protein n=1 Tax=Cognatishimia sp. F0-27 TaxID=2816855 RepID=UPI001D0C82D4|nr:relaxase/mobilization nuclease domain-containing protein [Cognatishimia sp. F0-27]MCC1493818.1 hypothetical protein [Cognatishimia sp. F0-27]
MERVTLKLSEHAIAAAGRIARDQDITLGQLIRDLLDKEIARRRCDARPPNRADERLLAPLRARLAPSFAEAKDWQDLQMRLRDHGVTLRPAGGGLALYEYRTEQRLCKASELGWSYSRLVHRFREGFPGHAHTWIAQRVAARMEPSESNDLFDPIDDADHPGQTPRQTTHSERDLGGLH